jgi:hypothetical protein
MKFVADQKIRNLRSHSNSKEEHAGFVAMSKEGGVIGVYCGGVVDNARMRMAHAHVRVCMLV